MKGSCLCGAIGYEVDRLDSPIQHCSCRSCRKAHAAAFNTFAHVLKTEFRWTQGEAALRAYESSPGKRRRFCGVCGTPLIAELQGHDDVILRVATLDDDPGLRPVRQIWASQAAPWLQSGPHLEICAQWGPDGD